MTLITLSGVILFMSLGVWQLNRAAYKQTILNRFEARLQAEFTVFNEQEELYEQEYSRVIMQGHYDLQRTLLLDNQLSQGRAGYHVISPFLLNSGKYILINRGWVALGASRQKLPKIKVPENINEVRGVIVRPVSEGFRMGEIVLDDSWPKVVPFVDVGILQPVFDGQLLPMMMWLSPQQDDFYERNWQPVWLSPEKSEAYAVQWFSFAVIAAILFVFLNLRKLDERESSN
ncbi:MAG: SURF1 family protein [Gammaproteobacteria bacterium]|nr:SURF1 family protein [Gammaproteobacteria bacterium]